MKLCYTFIVAASDQPIVNTQKLEEVISLYKVPLVFACIGVILLAIPLVLLAKNSTVSSSNILFETAQKTASSSSSVHVDVAGAVARPGVYEFTLGARIEDALSRAGGLSSEADRLWIEKNLNRAAKLTDGGKLYIPKAGEQLTVKSAGSSAQRSLGVTTGLVNINTASQTELEALPGVGPVTAGNIISGRPYGFIDELKTKKIVGESLFGKMKDLISAP